MKKVTIYSDGGCLGNPGPGGWAAVLSSGHHNREISGGEPATTNNRMELTAAIEALNTLKEPCEVEFFTDSQYVKNGVTAWVKSWKQNGWRTKSRKPVKNEDLWRTLDLAAARHTIHWHWVKGHSGFEKNERCDILANEAIAKIHHTFSADQLRTALAEFIAKNATQSVEGDLFGEIKSVG